MRRQTLSVSGHIPLPEGIHSGRRGTGFFGAVMCTTHPRKVPDSSGFVDCAMSSSGLTYRLRQHLHKSARLYDGETCQFSVLQYSQAAGADEVSLMVLGQMRSTGTLKQCLDSTRHEDPGGPSRSRAQRSPRPLTMIRSVCGGKGIGVMFWRRTGARCPECLGSIAECLALCVREARQTSITQDI